MAASALARRALADARVRTVSFTLLFFFAAAAQVTTYRSTYPTRADRLELARGLGANQALRLLYGLPHDLLTVGGWAAWRLGALTIFSALFGLLAAIRALRAEEDAGRAELVLSGAVSRATAFAAALAGIGIELLALWAGLFAGLETGRPGTGGAAYLALALVSPAAVFAGVGAVASQLAPTRRGALQLGGAVLVLALLIRMVADDSVAGLRWATPLGWAEELRPFAGPQPLALVPIAAATVLLGVAAQGLSQGRDVGAGILPARDHAAPDLRLLASPAGLALRTLRGGLLGWLAGIAVYALLIGALADSVSSSLSRSLREQLAKLGTGAATAEGFVGFAFLFFLLALSLFACYQLAAVHEEAAEHRLETLFALPVGRRRWLGERLAIAAGAAVGLALVAGLLTWAGAAAQGAGVSLGRTLEAGANCLPVVLLFLALGALALAVVPRAGAAVAYGLVGVAFLWDAVGALAGAPGWLLALSPFHDVGLVPAEPFEPAGAAVMLALAALAAAVATREFARRDLAE